LNSTEFLFHGIPWNFLETFDGIWWNSVLSGTSQTYNKRHKIQHIRAQTRALVIGGTSEEKQTTFRNEVKNSRVTTLPWQTHVGNIDRISIINTFNPLKGFSGTVRSTVSRMYLKRLVLLLMQLFHRKIRRIPKSYFVPALSGLANLKDQPVSMWQCTLFKRTIHTLCLTNTQRNFLLLSVA
jgi:hypothetical protein